MPLKNTDAFGNPINSKWFRVGIFRICMLTPVLGQIVVEVPWQRGHEPNDEEQLAIQKQVQWLLNYLSEQGLTGGSGIGYEVHPQYAE
jgi:hypothetical protein